jgi:Cysteine-rich secretory protein family
VKRRRALALGICALVFLAIDGVAAAANSAADVCRRWVCDRADMSEGVSTGDVTTCAPGDLLPPGRPNALKLVNLYRFLAGMPAVTEDSTFDTDAQACAIIQAANGLSHTPTPSDSCYNATGATASNLSSICGGQAVGCIDLYMDDSANATGPNFGHRTWILANSLGPVGFGSVGSGRPDDDRLMLLSGRRDG